MAVVALVLVTAWLGLVAEDLEEVHGAAYRDYQRRVGRFRPGLGRRG
jgi:protein-S-isoprenylcysteine O-methyltransferase Ste14